jgi:hypothetical protein
MATTTRTNSASLALQDAFHYAGCLIGKSEEFWIEIENLSRRDRLRLMIGRAVAQCEKAGFPFSGRTTFRSLEDGERIAWAIFNHVESVSMGWCDPHTGTLIETTTEEIDRVKEVIEAVQVELTAIDFPCPVAFDFSSRESAQRVAVALNAHCKAHALDMMVSGNDRLAGLSWQLGELVEPYRPSDLACNCPDCV